MGIDLKLRLPYSIGRDWFKKEADICRIISKQIINCSGSGEEVSQGKSVLCTLSIGGEKSGDIKEDSEERGR